MNSYDGLSIIKYILQRKDMRQIDKFETSMRILIDCCPWTDLSDDEFITVNRSYETICRVRTLNYKLIILERCVNKILKNKSVDTKLKSLLRKKQEENIVKEYKDVEK